MYSIVVCTYNGQRTIAECLTALLNQSVSADQYEILVIDDGSVDELANVVRRVIDGRTNCTYIRLPMNRGLSAARNIGWQTARGDIVFYIDDDAIADPDWLERLSETYVDSVAGAGGLMRPAIHNIFSSYEIGLQRVTYGVNAERLDGAGGNNMSFRRKVLAEIGGFDERFVAVADDADINRRLLSAGFRLVVRSDITVRHYMPTSVRQFWKKKVGRGRGSHIFNMKYAKNVGWPRPIVRLAYYVIALPLHLVKGFAVGASVEEVPLSLHFAALHCLDRVASAYGETLQSLSL